MKKVLSLLLALVMVLSLVACGDGGASSSAGAAGSGSQEEIDLSKYEVTEPITIEFWHNYSNEARATFLQEVADAFNASQEYITVNPVFIGGYPVIAEQVAGALAAGTAVPALSTINYPRTLQFAASEIIEPLDEYFAAYDTDLDDYLDGMLDGVSDKNGTIYGMPFGVSAGVCIYNKTVLDDLSLPFPETWEEFKVWCKEVHEATGKVAFGFPYDFNYLNTFFLNITGMDPLGDGTVSVLDDPAFLEFVYNVKELIDAGYCSWIGTSINNAQDDCIAAFALGELIAYTDTSSSVMKVTDTVDFEVGTAIGVTGTEKEAITTASGAALIIYADNDQAVKNAAFQFAVYLSSAENNQKWVTDTCMFPSHYSVIDSGALSELYERYPGAQSIFDNADRVVAKNRSSAMQTCMEIVADNLALILTGQVSDIEGAWATMKAEVDMELADANS